MTAARTGLAAFHCRRHVEHRARHGSHWHGTYRAADLRPYLAAATSYVGTRKETDRFIAASIAAVRTAMELAGPTELATRLMGMPARKRAKIAVARLRAASIGPERIVSIVFAVTALIKEDPGSHRVKEFRTVQIAKATHRLASGSHWAWELQDAYGRPRRSEMHVFPRSTGPVLRIMGRMLEEPCEVAIDKHLAAVLALKIKRYGRHPGLSDPAKISQQSLS
jgi:hypothetical protein